jgi:hypothetical protein
MISSGDTNNRCRTKITFSFALISIRSELTRFPNSISKSNHSMTIGYTPKIAIIYTSPLDTVKSHKRVRF